MTLIYATTDGQTEAIFEMWTNGDKDAAAKFLVTCTFSIMLQALHIIPSKWQKKLLSVGLKIIFLSCELIEKMN